MEESRRGSKEKDEKKAGGLSLADRLAPLIDASSQLHCLEKRSLISHKIPAEPLFPVCCPHF